MKKKSVTNNIIYNMLFQIFTTFVPVIITPYISRTLGLKNNSIYSFVETIVTLIAIVGSLGTFLYGCRKIAYVRDDKYELSKATYEIIFLKLILLIPVLLIYFMAFCISGNYKIYFLISAITIVSSSLEITWFFNGIEDFKTITIRNFVIKISFVLCLFIFIKNQNDLVKYFWLVVINGLVSNICMWPLLRKYIYPIKQIKNFSIISHLKESFILFIPQSANYLYSYSDKIMIGVLTPNLSNVGIYDYAYRIIKLIIGLMQSIGYALLSRISNLSGKKDIDGIKKYINLSIKFTLFLALPMMFGLLGISDIFIPLYLGNEYMETAKVITYLSSLIVITSLNSVLGVQLLLAIKKDKEYIKCTVYGALINIILNFVLIPRYGIYGACITSVISEFIVLVMEYRYSKEYIIIKEIVIDIAKYIICSVIIFVICILIKKISANMIITLLIQICISSLFYFVTLYLAKDEIMQKIIVKLKSVIKRSTK